MKKQIIIDKATELGFDLIGFAKYETLDKEIKELETWLKNKFNAGMSYMERNIEKRKDVRKIFETTESIISLAMNYFVEDAIENNKEVGKISRYAWGRDYHFTIWEKLDELVEYLKKIYPQFEAKTFIDTAPVMDKVWAVKAGLGWQGKHSNIISKKIGSWFFIATIFTNQKFDSYDVPLKNFCGTCTACIDACPTNAIVQDYIVDSNKCISYLTIENKNEIPNEFLGKFENLLFGCDICQDVCPWNKNAKRTNIVDFLNAENKALNLNKILKMKPDEFKKKFKESPILRPKLKGMKRNAEFILKSDKRN